MIILAFPWVLLGAQEDDAVIAQVVQKTFGADPPKVLKMWLTDPVLQKDLKAILERDELPLRQRYYQHGQKRLWVLDEVGHTLVITMGILTENNAIVDQKVLIYRETRGGEVQQQAYLNQYKKLQLQDNLELSKNIDGITGATLSCRALTKMARYALRLEKFLNSP